mmetsp:Transcript_21979/g.45208  ORF Transcript_21979/g.45208 Transcript_21979/m.45208 type:complete len:312 (+) Transcript_21979:60-995(+)
MKTQQVLVKILAIEGDDASESHQAVIWWTNFLCLTPFLQAFRSCKFLSSPHKGLLVLGIVSADSQTVVAKGRLHDYRGRTRDGLLQGLPGGKWREIVVQKTSQWSQVGEGRRVFRFGGVDADGQAVHTDTSGNVRTRGHDGRGHSVQGCHLDAAHELSRRAPLRQVNRLVGRSHLLDGSGYGVGDSENLVGIVGKGLGKGPKERRGSREVFRRVNALPFSRHETGGRGRLPLTDHLCLVFQISNQHFYRAQRRFFFLGAGSHQICFEIGERKGCRRDIGGDGREQAGCLPCRPLRCECRCSAEGRDCSKIR